jgi:hypothetical protein
MEFTTIVNEVVQQLRVSKAFLKRKSLSVTPGVTISSPDAQPDPRLYHHRTDPENRSNHHQSHPQAASQPQFQPENDARWAR